MIFYRDILRYTTACILRAGWNSLPVVTAHEHLKVRLIWLRFTKLFRFVLLRLADLVKFQSRQYSLDERE